MQSLYLRKRALGRCKHLINVMQLSFNRNLRLPMAGVTVLLVLTIMAGRTAVASQDAKEPGVIQSIEFQGLVQTSDSFVRDLVGIKAGDSFQKKSLDEAVSRILRSGRFAGATYTTESNHDGVKVTFALRERVLVKEIRFEGNQKFSDGKLKKESLVEIGKPVDRFVVREGQDSIISMYRDAGYSDIAVTVDQEQLEEDGVIIYRIAEGEHTQVREIVFEGATAYSSRVLKRQIETKTALWVLRAGTFDEERMLTDAARLQTFYRDRGYLDAIVKHRKETVEGDRGLRAVFLIEEGVRYSIEAVQFEGQTVFSREELLEMVTSTVGEFVDRPKIDADVRTIKGRYGELGYIHARSRAVRVFSEEPGLVRVTFQISEGNRFRVGRVAVRGNTRTKDKVVRRALNLYPPDDYLNLTEARKAERQLVESKIFSSARVLPVGDAPDVRDIVIDVQEADRLGDFLFSAGVTSNNGLVGSIVIDLQNFDLHDLPRSWSEFYKFQAFTGAGQRMRVELQPGSDLSRFRVDFTEPFFRDKPIRLDVGAFLFERGRDGYDEGRTGVTASLGKRFQKGLLRGWSGELAFRLENASVDNPYIFAAKEIREDKGSHLLTSVKGTLVRDRTDSRFVPTTGDRFRLSYEQFGAFGGDEVFGRLRTRYIRYKTIRTDVLDRKSVLQFRAEGGAIVGDAPVFERFYAGGIGSIRGFDFRGVGPHEGLEDNNIGGDFMVLLGTQYSFPVYAENVRGHVFLDTGTVGSGYRASVGVGVRLTINVLGPVPLEFNVALPFASEADDEEQVFSFVIGSLF